MQFACIVEFFKYDIFFKKKKSFIEHKQARKMRIQTLQHWFHVMLSVKKNKKKKACL